MDMDVELDMDMDREYAQECVHFIKSLCDARLGHEQDDRLDMAER